MLISTKVIKGFNCTIFAYGQTGTGKTYTMCGNTADHTPLVPDDAGIIPRVLHSLFRKLEPASDSSTDAANTEYSVKVSFIELYNEELRDLLSVDDKAKLKIFEGDSKRGAATLVQGMEERHITTAKKGIELLRDGSQKRQVAATKCNDLSSRSHTIFTITAYTKKILSSGEEFVSSGKLNLVDLAGSENIGRSGAENKRAAEAGLINRSLLTLGRVINALVDKSAHIPYRESKLTRLLQDSLGGRTKTCIIATVSAATSNLEETISSLEYAFRAKNIKNKPQIKLMPKKTHLREITSEMEKLQAELTATRQRNGVYLTDETYERLMNESESNRILLKEQREKIETTEDKLARKGRDLLELASNFDIIKKNSEAAEKQLNEFAADNAALEVKLSHSTKLHAQNRQRFTGTQLDVQDTTRLVHDRLVELHTEQQGLVDSLSTRIHAFVESELLALRRATTTLEGTGNVFERSQGEIMTQTTNSKKELDSIVDEVKLLREEVDENVGAGLQNLEQVANRILEGIVSEVDGFRLQIDSSSKALATDFRKALGDISKEFNEQRAAMQRLQREMTEANRQLQQSQSQPVDALVDFMAREQAAREQDSQDLMSNIQKLVEEHTQKQELRAREVAQIPEQLKSAGQCHDAAAATFTNESDQLLSRSNSLSEKLTTSGETIEARIRNEHSVSSFTSRPRNNDGVTNMQQNASKFADTIKSVTSSIHNDANQVVKEQTEFLNTETSALDRIVNSLLKNSNVTNASRDKAFSALMSATKQSYVNAISAFAASSHRMQGHDGEVTEQVDSLSANLALLKEDAPVCKDLAELRERTENCIYADDSPAHTAAHEEESYEPALSLKSGSDVEEAVVEAPSDCDDMPAPSPTPRSPQTFVPFADSPADAVTDAKTKSVAAPSTANGVASLRELDINALRSSTIENAIGGVDAGKVISSTLKRPSEMSASTVSKVAVKRSRPLMSRADRENQAMGDRKVSVQGASVPRERALRRQARRSGGGTG